MPRPPGRRRRASSNALSTAAKRAANLGLEVHAGHGLTYNNVMPVAAISEIVELNIGHCIIARAIFTGLEAAVRDMKALMAGRAPMIFGIGVDVLEAARIKKVLARFGDHFVDRLLMPAERAQLGAHEAARAIHRHALRRQGSHRQGHGHGLRARHLDPRRRRRAERAGASPKWRIRRAAKECAASWASATAT